MGIILPLFFIVNVIDQACCGLIFAKLTDSETATDLKNFD